MCSVQRWKMCSVVYALDLYNCVYMYEVITVKKKVYNILVRCSDCLCTDDYNITFDVQCIWPHLSNMIIENLVNCKAVEVFG